MKHFTQVGSSIGYGGNCEPRADRVADRSGRTKLFRLSVAAMVLGSPALRIAEAQQCAVPTTIVGDRPGFLTGPTVLAMGSVQIESGWAMARQSTSTVHAIGTMLLRLPVSCFAEVRFAAGGYMVSRAPSAATSSGMADAYAGTKIRIAKGSGIRPHLAMFAGTTVPVGGAFSHNGAEPDAALSALWDLPKGQSALAYTGLASRVGAIGRETERLSGVSWSVPLGTRAGTFVEASEFVRRNARTRYLTTGLQLFPHATLQLDGTVSVPLPRAGSDISFGLGVSRRW